LSNNIQKSIITVNTDTFPAILGVRDDNFRYLQKCFDSDLVARDGKFFIKGQAEELGRIKRVFNDLQALYKMKRNIDISDIEVIVRMTGIKLGTRNTGNSMNNNQYSKVKTGKVRALGEHQARYIKAMEKYEIVFASGSAGTGKTYLALGMAAELFFGRVVDKIILVRPVVESGETLGFLPGDILDKVDPYFRPLYDALDEIMSRDKVRKYIANGQIEIAPLAYMRGRTLNNAFVILDEAQNTTLGQMKMFLTRLGSSSRTVLTGDLSQIDLKGIEKCGLEEAMELLGGIDGIGFVKFDEGDVVRHRLVADILRAYSKQTTQEL